MRASLSVVVLLAVVFALRLQDEAKAHITVVSPFTYHRDIAPILERRCLSCHAKGGVGPTAFGSYQEARSQSVAIRRSIMSGQMPPWSGHSDTVALRERASLTTRELDMLMTWAAGGTPEGAPLEATAGRVQGPPLVRLPDAVIAMPEPYVLRGDQLEADHEVELPSAAAAGRWIQAAVLRPEQPALVRRAEILIRSKTGEEVVDLWLPGEGGPWLSGNGAFQVPNDGRLVLRIHYRNPRPLEPMQRSDRSSVALFFASRPQQVQARRITIGRTVIPRSTRAVAFRVASATSGAEVSVDVTLPGAKRSMLLRFVHRPDWRRRYSFVSPLPLPQGTVIDVHVTTASSPEIRFEGILEAIE